MVEDEDADHVLRTEISESEYNKFTQPVRVEDAARLALPTSPVINDNGKLQQPLLVSTVSLWSLVTSGACHIYIGDGGGSPNKRQHSSHLSPNENDLHKKQFKGHDRKNSTGQKACRWNRWWSERPGHRVHHKTPREQAEDVKWTYKPEFDVAAPEP